MLIGGDCNASVGSDLSTYVGCHDPDLQDLAGECLHRQLQQVECWLPASFAEHHSGQSWTYRQKRGQALSRIDFIALPLAWRRGEIESRVVSSIHAGQPVIDHVAVLCDVRVMIDAGSRTLARPRPRLDARAIADPVNRETVRQIVTSVPDVPWHVSSHVHAAIVVGHLQGRLSEAFPLPKRGHARRFLSATSLECRGTVTRIRRACCRLRCQVRQQLLRVAFCVWRLKGGGPGISDFVASPYKQALLAAARYTYELGRMTLRLKRQYHDDRVRYMEGLADQVAQAPLGQAFAAVHSLLGHKRKKSFTLDVLPWPRVLMASKFGCDGKSISLVLRKGLRCPPHKFLSMPCDLSHGACPSA